MVPYYALEPPAQSLIAGGVLVGYADAATRAGCLPKIASGEALVVLAYQERAARYKLDAYEAKSHDFGAGTLTVISSCHPVAEISRRTARCAPRRAARSA